MKKKRGFTLIEMIIVVSIMSIIGGCSVISVQYYKTIKNKIDADYYCNAVVSFINNSKMYCRENTCSAVITFDIPGNQMMLHADGMPINNLALSNKITLDNVNVDQSKMGIDNKGYIKEAYTITLKGNNLVKHKITVRVGTEYIKIIE